MNPSKRVEYKDSDGLSVSLYRLITLEPTWAESRINYSVDKIAELESANKRLKIERDRYRQAIIDYLSPDSSPDVRGLMNTLGKHRLNKIKPSKPWR